MVPPTLFSGTVPRILPIVVSVNSTTPPGDPAPGVGIETTAVIDTCCLEVELFGRTASEVSVGALLTTCGRVAEEEVAKLALARNTAVKLCVPGVRLLSVTLKRPLSAVIGSVMLLPFSWITTWPVAGTVPGNGTCTPIEKVTDWPQTEGFAEDTIWIDV